MTPEDINKQQALSPGPWYLQIGNGSMPYYIMTPLDKTIVAATVYRCDADYIIEMSAKITDLEGKVKILESLLESEQTILKLRTTERDKLTIENKQLKIDYAIYEACKIEMNRLYRQVGDIKNIIDLSDADSHQMLLRDVRAIQSILK